MKHRTVRQTTLNINDMDFDKLYDMFCEYYHDDGSNEEIMRGRIEKAFLKYAQTLVKNCSIPDVSQQRELLFAFTEHINTYLDSEDGFNIGIVDEFIANNCG